MLSTTPFGENPTARAEIPPRVLVVDDEPLVRWSLRAGLHHAGFDAVSAADGLEARRLAAETPQPMVVLLDMGLWGTDTEALLDDLRLVLPRSRFLILATGGAQLAAPRGDGITVLRKPFDLPNVTRLVEAAVIAVRESKPSIETRGLP